MENNINIPENFKKSVAKTILSYESSVNLSVNISINIIEQKITELHKIKKNCKDEIKDNER